MKKVTLILGHPEFGKSIANKKIVNKINQEIEHVAIRNIYEMYPDFKINVPAEQEALIESDIIIIQYPFYWYNMPAILKQWFDEVFSFNFAYGPKGNKLKGKYFIPSFTIGGQSDSYSPLGYNHFRIDDFMKPIEQTAYLAQMEYIQPIYSHGMVFIPDVYNTIENVEEGANLHAERLAAKIKSLQAEKPEQKINNFIKDWFAHLDEMAEDGYFTNFISKDAIFVFPEGKFIGHDGFRQWYAGMKKKIKPQNRHNIESLGISKNESVYNVNLTVKVEGQNYEEKEIHLAAKESWKVELTRDNRIKIKEYIVKSI